MKKLAVLFGLTGVIITNSISTFAKSSNLESVFPNLPLVNSEYAESVKELPVGQKDSSILGNAYTDHNGEIHSFGIFNGRLNHCTYNSEIVSRAELTIDNVDSNWISKLSSDNSVNILMITIRTECIVDDYEDIQDNDIDRQYLCLYGDKAMQWFIYNGSPQDFLPASHSNISFVTRFDSVNSDEERGCALYYPIVVMNNNFYDLYRSEEFSDFKIYVYYEDEDWIIPDKLEFVLSGMNHLVDIDDIKATSDFKQKFISFNPAVTDGKGVARAERRAKIEEYYSNIPEYDPFSDENYGKEPEEIEKEEEKEEKENQTKKEDIIYEEEPEKIETEKVIIPYDPSMTQEELDSLFQPQPIPVPDEYDDEGTTYYNVGKDGKPVENPVSIYIDGKLILPEQAPIVDNNRVLVPMRIIFEALGAEVIWKAEDKTITARKEDKVVVLQIGNSVMKNGESEIPLDTAPVLQNSFTMIPIRAVAEAFDANVIWNEFDRAVVIETK